MSVRKAAIKFTKRIAYADCNRDYEEGLRLLCDAIIQIFHKNAKTLSYEMLYRTTYKLTLHQHGEKLYEGVKQVIGDYLDALAETTIVPRFTITAETTKSSCELKVVDGANAGVGVGPCASFLHTMELVWNDYTTAMTMIQYALYYLDDKLPSYNLPHIFDMGLDLFRDKIVQSEKYPIQDDLINNILYQIQLERLGDAIDRNAIKLSVFMLLELTNRNSLAPVYATDFEPKYLETSTIFYQAESQTLTNSNHGAPEFMRKVERRLSEEEERTYHYLSIMTEPKIRMIVETQLIANNLKTIMGVANSGLENMLDNNKYDDLSRMYNLFSRVPTGLNKMKSAIYEYILQKGKEINQQVSSAMSSTVMHATKAKSAEVPGGSRPALRWIEQVLDLQNKMETILGASTKNDNDYQTYFNAAIQQFINENPRSAEFISLFIDENLKKGLKGKTEEEVDELLDKAIKLFRFLDDKDVFERYYKQHLAKRLLLNRSVLDDAERDMVGKLKRECGYQFTTKLEGMFNDMRISVEMNSRLKDYKNQTTDTKEDLETSTTVLTSTFWPMNLSIQPLCILPRNVINACRSFEQFYHSRHSGRRLTWQYQLGTADVKAQFKSGKYTLNVSTYGMVVLLLFNTVGDNISFDDIQQQTNIPKNDLIRVVNSLACAKYKILLKSGKVDVIQPGERFKINDNFKSKLARIKVQTSVAKVESNSEQEHTHEKVDEERQHQIEAAIVRIMKNRKMMSHNSLITETTKQLNSRFMPNPVMIKKRIEALIDREYLERDMNSRQQYRYLA